MPNADRVILKHCRPNSDLIAFLPDAPANPGRILSYMHIGQHGEASLGFMRECLPADPSAPDAVALLLELRSIGYAVKLCRRLPANRRSRLPRRRQMSRKYEDREELDAAIEQIASQIEDKDVADHIRENASGNTGRLWLPAVYSESNNYLRRKIVAELGSSEPSGYMSEEHGWSLESWL